MNFTLHQLKIWTVIVEKQSITKAAESLHMTQPAVSIQLKNLQDQFAFPLTELIGKRLVITDFGKEMYEVAQNILAQVDNINYQTQLHKGFLAGKLKIAVVSTGKYVMPYFLQPFLAKHSHVDLVMDVANRKQVLESIEKNSFDFALVSVLPTNFEVHELGILPNKLMLVGPNSADVHALSNKKNWQNLPLIYREEGSGTRFTMQQFFKKANIQPRVKLALTSNEAVKQAVIAGLGYSVLSIVSLRNELKMNDLTIVDVPGFPLYSEWKLIWPANKKLTKVAAAYLQHLQENKVTIQEQHFSWMKDY
ncbi:MAG: LysR family transcriptional regulator [Chitinophagaceae bacterium]